MARITGRVEVLVNGQLLLNKPGWKANGIHVSGQAPYEVTPVVGDTGIHGYLEKTLEASCEGSITDRDDVMLGDLAAIKGNGTVIFRALGGGKVYTLSNAFCTGNFTVTAGEGETSIKFIGDYWTESTEAS